MQDLLRRASSTKRPIVFQIINANHGVSLNLKLRIGRDHRAIFGTIAFPSSEWKLNQSGPVAIVSQQIRASSSQPAKDTLSRELSKLGGDVSGGLEAAQDALEVEDQAGDVRGGHAGAGDDVGGRVGADPRRERVNARGEDVDDAAVVAPRRLSVVDSDRADSNSLRRAGRRVVNCVDASVTCCHDRRDTCVVGGGHGCVEGGGEAAA